MTTCYSSSCHLVPISNAQPPTPKPWYNSRTRRHLESTGGSAMFGRLYIEEGERPARMIELAGAVTIGRTADNDIVLESDGVSHCHAMLLAQSDGVTLLDLGSTFGTFVDTVQALPDEPMRLPN